MISHLTTTAMLTDRSVIAACPSGASLSSTGMCASLLPVSLLAERSERPMQAPVVAATAMARPDYRFAASAHGAGAGIAKVAASASGLGNGQQKVTQQHGTWAFRGLRPWSDPA